MIEFLKSLHYWCAIRELTAWLIEREGDISRQIIKHVTDRYKDTPASSRFERIVSWIDFLNRLPVLLF